MSRGENRRTSSDVLRHLIPPQFEIAEPTMPQRLAALSGALALPDLSHFQKDASADILHSKRMLRAFTGVSVCTRKVLSSRNR
jgi:hypothetical protein